MTNDDLRRAYADLLHARPAVTDHARVPLESILALVERRGTEAARMETLDRVMVDRASIAEFELLRSIAESQRTQTRASRRVSVIAAISLAAAMLLIAIPILTSRQDPVDAVRDVAPASTLISPPANASAGESRTFRWNAVPGARAYTLEILSDSGVVLFGTRSADTSVTVPTAIRFAKGTDYQWWVVSEMPDGTQRRSPFRRLTIVTP